MSDSSYGTVYSEWQADPEHYWAQAAEAITWHRPYDRVFDPAAGPYGHWFVGGELNTCYNALDRHVEAGNGERTALIWDSAMVGEVRRFTYAALRDRVARVAGALRSEEHTSELQSHHDIV